MFFRCLSGLLLCALASFGAGAEVLRVCADPNNLPFSNQAEQGFENRIASLLAKEMHAELRYTWWVERKSFLKNSLEASLCDVVLGAPSMIDSVSTTAPYYRSSYVFVSRKDRRLDISSLLDARLDSLRIGIHVVGDDYAPPAQLLARRALASRLIGYSLYGTVGEKNPPARLIEAVVQCSVDIAIVWGPFAGYFSKNQSVPLTITPVSPAMFLTIPFTYDISAAVRKDDLNLKARIDEVFAQECGSIAAILSEYAIPLVPGGQPKCDGSQSAVSLLR